MSKTSDKLNSNVSFLSVGYAYMHRWGLQDCIVISIRVQLSFVHQSFYTGEVHVARLGLEWVLGWIRPKKRVFAPTRRVRALDQLWYLFTSKPILTKFKILQRFGWRILYKFVSMNHFVSDVSIFQRVLYVDQYPLRHIFKFSFNPNFFPYSFQLSTRCRKLRRK